MRKTGNRLTKIICLIVCVMASFVTTSCIGVTKSSVQTLLDTIKDREIIGVVEQHTDDGTAELAAYSGMISYIYQTPTNRLVIVEDYDALAHVIVQRLSSNESGNKTVSGVLCIEVSDVDKQRLLEGVMRRYAAIHTHLMSSLKSGAFARIYEMGDSQYVLTTDAADETNAFDGKSEVLVSYYENRDKLSTLTAYCVMTPETKGQTVRYAYTALNKDDIIPTGITSLDNVEWQSYTSLEVQELMWCEVLDDCPINFMAYTADGQTPDVSLSDDTYVETATGYIIRQEDCFVVYDSYVPAISPMKYDVNLSGIQSEDDAWTIMRSQIIAVAQVGYGNTLISNVTIDTTEKVSALSVEATKVKGHVSFTGDTSDTEYIAYRFIISGKPAYIAVYCEERCETDIEALIDTLVSAVPIG